MIRFIVLLLQLQTKEVENDMLQKRVNDLVNERPFISYIFFQLKK